MATKIVSLTCSYLLRYRLDNLETWMNTNDNDEDVDNVNVVNVDDKQPYSLLSTTLMSLINATLMIYLYLWDIIPTSILMDVLFGYLFVDLFCSTNTRYMVAHHILGVAFVIVCPNLYREVVLMEGSTIILDLIHLLKMIDTTEYLLIPLKLLFVVMFYVLRILMLPILVYNGYIVGNNDIPCMQCISVSVLIYALQIYWFYLIMLKSLRYCVRRPSRQFKRCDNK